MQSDGWIGWSYLPEKSGESDFQGGKNRNAPLITGENTESAGIIVADVGITRRAETPRREFRAWEPCCQGLTAVCTLFCTGGDYFSFLIALSEIHHQASELGLWSRCYPSRHIFLLKDNTISKSKAGQANKGPVRDNVAQKFGERSSINLLLSIFPNSQQNAMRWCGIVQLVLEALAPYSASGRMNRVFNQS